MFATATVFATASALVLLFSALHADAAPPSPERIRSVELEDAPFRVATLARFNEPWAAAVLPDGRLLVTERPGKLYVVAPDGTRSAPVAGLPDVDRGGQGGLGDVLVHPTFAQTGIIYISYVEASTEAGADDLRGAAVARAQLTFAPAGPQLEDMRVIWRQVPKVTGRGHFGHRLTMDDAGFLFVTSGERQKFDPAQEFAQNLGKIVRLHDDGRIPADNPFHEQGGVAAEIWSLGHRNPLGLAFDARGQLWSHEMGPAHGDELNRIERGANYGYPLVSNGDHYDGRDLPDHATRPDLRAPEIYWKPAISPAGFLIYRGTRFRDWTGSGLIGGLSSKALIRVTFDGDAPREAERFAFGTRIRDLEEAQDGTLWVLEDGRRGRLLHLTPR
ncbi:MAG: PQQ-dependent sugar dehydrogenase [Gammaproteobacteria bacterium]